MNNCYNCKYCHWAHPALYNRKSNYLCYKQDEWIYHMEKECPLFKKSLKAFFFGDQTPKKNKKLVGGCVK